MFSTEVQGLGGQPELPEHPELLEQPEQQEQQEEELEVAMAIPQVSLQMGWFGSGITTGSRSTQMATCPLIVVLAWRNGRLAGQHQRRSGAATMSELPAFKQKADSRCVKMFDMQSQKSRFHEIQTVSCMIAEQNG